MSDILKGEHWSKKSLQESGGGEINLVPKSQIPCKKINLRRVSLLGKRKYNGQEKYLERVKGDARNRKMSDKKIRYSLW